MGFYSEKKKVVLRRVLRRGSEKAVSRRCPERPLGEYASMADGPFLLEVWGWFSTYYPIVMPYCLRFPFF